MKLIHFPSDGHSLAGNYLPVKKTEKPAVMFMHGGGTSHKGYYFEWQEYLAEYGYPSLAIDFTGVEDSEGAYEDGNLNQRMQDGLAAVDWLSKHGYEQIVVEGSSMGGHVAARICNRHPNIVGLILHSAAAYGEEAEDKPLNGAFTKVLRQPERFRNSPAFIDLQDFTGNVYLSYGEHEELIPAFVQDKYREVVESLGGMVFEIPGAQHMQLDPKQTKKEQRLDVYSKSRKFLDSIGV